MSLQDIALVSFGYFENEFLEKVAGEISRDFQFQVRIKEGHMDLSEFYDPARRQYNGNSLLKEVDSRFGGDSLKTFGLFNVDLFIPILTYIFGQAFLNGRSGIRRPPERDYRGRCGSTSFRDFPQSRRQCGVVCPAAP